MHSDYQIPVLRELRDQQVRFAPREKKVEQLDRAEKLLHEIDAERDLHIRISLFPNHRLSSRELGWEGLFRGGEAQSRFAAVHRRSLGFGQY